MCHPVHSSCLPMFLKGFRARFIVFCTVLKIPCTAGCQMFRSGSFSAKRLKVSAAIEGGHTNGSHPSGMAEGRSGQEEVRMQQGECWHCYSPLTPFQDQAGHQIRLALQCAACCHQI